jgi:AcrR family transcriptional regulator
MTTKRKTRSEKRPYRKRKRAEAEEETRRRITESAVELHGTVGPANTTVTELAQRAGVSRMTVYNHFPTDLDLYQACSSHWASRNPFPDPTGWLRHEDPRARLRSALLELYDWYDRKQGMLANVLRDAPLLPTFGAFMEGYWGGYMNAILDVLSRGWCDEEKTDGPLRTSLRLVVDFHTWRTLTEAGMANGAAAELAARMVQGAHATVAASASDGERLLAYDANPSLNE